MGAIFLSASVPLINRGNYHESADPFLIQCAVRELVMAVIKTQQIVWGGHPAITPMIWSICEDLGIDYAKSVVLYQSRFFEDQFPDENKHFGNVVFVDAVSNDRDASLLSMRESMLSRSDLTAAVFIGAWRASRQSLICLGAFILLPKHWQLQLPVVRLVNLPNGLAYRKSLHCSA